MLYLDKIQELYRMMQSRQITEEEFKELKAKVIEYKNDSALSPNEMLEELRLNGEIVISDNDKVKSGDEASLTSLLEEGILTREEYNALIYEKEFSENSSIQRRVDSVNSTSSTSAPSVSVKNNNSSSAFIIIAVVLASIVGLFFAYFALSQNNFNDSASVPEKIAFVDELVEATSSQMVDESFTGVGRFTFGSPLVSTTNYYHDAMSEVITTISEDGETKQVSLSEFKAVTGLSDMLNDNANQIVSIYERSDGANGSDKSIGIDITLSTEGGTTDAEIYLFYEDGIITQISYDLDNATITLDYRFEYN